MTVAAAVVRWGAVAVVLVVLASTAEGTGLVDVSRCTDSCSVPEDLWPSCCETHSTCCQEFAESCMHDCLPRVHTGDVSVVEERPGMCCALYNLCCFRETFRISSGSKKQEPVSFPIIHRFHVHPPTANGNNRPQPRPFSPAEKSPVTPDQDSSKRPTFSRPQDSKKPFRSSRPGGLNKLPGSGGDNTEESKKLRARLKLPSFRANRKDQENEFKVTRRPAGVDIRQEIFVPEVGEAASMGNRRLDASINPVVTRKRLLVSSPQRHGRGDSKKQEQEQETSGRKPQGNPAREGRTLGAGRSSGRPAPSQQASGRQQTTIVAGQENPRPPTRRPFQPKQDDTPKVTVKETPSVTPPSVKIPEIVKESESPVAEGEEKDSIDSIISALQQAQDTPDAAPSTPLEQSPAEDNPVAAASQAEEAVEKAPELPTETPVEKKVETDLDVADPEEAPANTAFIPPEIVVDTPEEPKEETPTTTIVEPTPDRSADSRSTPARGQPSGTATSQDQTRSRSVEQTRGRDRTTSRGQNEDRTSSRTTDQAAVRGASESTRQTQTKERSRTRGRTETPDTPPVQANSRTRG